MLRINSNLRQFNNVIYVWKNHFFLKYFTFILSWNFQYLTMRFNHRLSDSWKVRIILNIFPVVINSKCYLFIYLSVRCFCLDGIKLTQSHTNRYDNCSLFFHWINNFTLMNSFISIAQWYKQSDQTSDHSKKKSAHFFMLFGHSVTYQFFE